MTSKNPRGFFGVVKARQIAGHELVAEAESPTDVLIGRRWFKSSYIYASGDNRHAIRRSAGGHECIGRENTLRIELSIKPP